MTSDADKERARKDIERLERDNAVWERERKKFKRRIEANDREIARLRELLK